MKVIALAATAAIAFSAVEAEKESSLHLRIHDKNWCTITNESQCDGQNWTGSTCCADPSYECRWSDDGQNVKRCQKKHSAHQHHKAHEKGGSCTITNESQCDGQNWTGSTCCADPNYECRWSDDGQNVKRCQKKHSAHQHHKDVVEVASSEDDGDDEDDSTDDESASGSSDLDDYYVTDGSNIYFIKDGSSVADDWADCTPDNVVCSNPTSVCVYYSLDYAECKPETLPSGELCGQDDGTNTWLYDYCPTGESCLADGTDYYCTADSK